MGTKDKITHALLRVCGFGSCADVKEGCYEYSEGQLTGHKEKRVKKHLKICKMCVRFIMSYMAVKALGKTLHPERLAPEQRQRILKELNLQS